MPDDLIPARGYKGLADSFHCPVCKDGVSSSRLSLQPPLTCPTCKWTGKVEDTWVHPVAPSPGDEARHGAEWAAHMREFWANEVDKSAPEPEGYLEAWFNPAWRKR